MQSIPLFKIHETDSITHTKLERNTLRSGFFIPWGDIS